MKWFFAKLGWILTICIVITNILNVILVVVSYLEMKKIHYTNEMVIILTCLIVVIFGILLMGKRVFKQSLFHKNLGKK